VGHAHDVPTITDCPNCRFPVLDAGEHCPFCGCNPRRPPRRDPLLQTREQRWLAVGMIVFGIIAIVAIAAALGAR